MPLRLRHIASVLVLSLAMAHPAAAQQDAEKTELGKHMSAMNVALRTIGGQVADPTKNASTLEQVAIIQSNATAAMTLEPEKKAQIPEGEQAQFVLDFQAGIKALLVTVDSLKSAVEAGRNEEAVAIIEAIKARQREGHGTFRIRKPPAPFER